MSDAKVKTCACGISYTFAEWLALRYCGDIEGVALRNCRCGSSICFDEVAHQRKLSEEEPLDDEEVASQLEESPWARAEREAAVDNMFVAAIVDGRDPPDPESCAPEEGWDWEVLP